MTKALNHTGALVSSWCPIPVVAGRRSPHKPRLPQSRLDRCKYVAASDGAFAARWGAARPLGRLVLRAITPSVKLAPRPTQISVPPRCLAH